MSDEDKKVEETTDSPSAEATEDKEQTTAEETPAEETKTEAEGTPAEESAEEAAVEETPQEEAVPAEESAADEATQPEAEEPEKEKDGPAQAWQAKLVGADRLKPGMTVRVHERITDVNSKGETKERIQIFEGIILYLRNAGISRTMTVRKVSKGYGVEKIYPINSPVVDKIEVTKIARVRRANLRYLGNLKQRFKRKLKETRLAVKK